MNTATTRLSQLDGFFVAYQERAGAAMQLTCDVELRMTAAHLDREVVHGALTAATARWPRLGQTLDATLTGLTWRGAPAVAAMLATAGDFDAWRNRALDPFREPPLQLLWRRTAADTHRLAFRAHHAACDGQAFMSVCATVLEDVAARAAGRATDARPEPSVAPTARQLWRRARLRRPRDVLALAASAARTARAARTGGSARLAIASPRAGDIAVCDHLILGEARGRVFDTARALGVTPPALIAAAWARALAAHNRARDHRDPRPVTLEVPVSLRRGRERDALLGNLVAPLVPAVDPEAPLAAVARDLSQQLRADMRRRAHFAMPLLTRGGGWLPWPLFRALAGNTAFSGFATSHVTWLDHHTDIHARVAGASAGAVQMGPVTLSTPVCLHMGAAVTAIPWTEGLQLSVTYRRAALDADQARALLDRTRDELLEELR